MNKSNRQGRKRLSVDLPIDMFNNLEFCAKNRNITITKYVIRSLFMRFKDEKILEPFIISSK